MFYQRLYAKKLFLLFISIGLLINVRKSYCQALPTAIGPGSYTNIGITGSFSKIDYGNHWTAGGSIYVDANLYRKFGAEIQWQRLQYNQEGGIRQTTLLAGPRYSFRHRGLVPYAKFMIGRGRFDFPYGYGYGTYTVLAPGAGIDYDIRPRIKLRLIDLSYQDWRNFTVGDLHPYVASTGISFRIF